MAVTDLTNTPLALITSDAVVRGIHTTTIKIDLSLNDTGDMSVIVDGGFPIANRHKIYELPAGAAILPASAGFITTALTGAGADGGKYFLFSRGDAGHSLTQEFVSYAIGDSFAVGINTGVSGGGGGYSAVATDIHLVLEGAATAGVIVLVLVWADIGNALSAGYREGDGTV